MAEENRETLAGMLEMDRELVVGSLRAERTPAKAREILEKETDRLMIRSAAASPDTPGQQAVQGMLRVIRNTLPFLESVSETEVWEKNTGAGKQGLHLSIPAILSLTAGLVCEAGALIGQSIAGRILRPGAVLTMLAGCALLVLGGCLTGRGRKEGRDGPVLSGARTGAGDREAMQTFLVDPDQVWHVLQGIALTADRMLEEAEEAGKAGSGSGAEQGQNPLKKQELSFFLELLENVYARRREDPEDASLREQVESIRYYLHTRGIDTEEFSEERSQWFEVLPSGGACATLRPALVQDGRLIRKGLAAV